jgi:3(or 17)beta-hydroxysteroid dehydrogenase
MQRLAGRTALVTGGASGLGKAIAQRLAAEGANIVITDIQVEQGSLTARDGGFTFLAHDVVDEAQWREVMLEVEKRFGTLHVLVNNAGFLGPMRAANPQNTTLASWKQVFAVNVEGVFLGCKAAIPIMGRGGGGSIVNIASIAGTLATPDATAYGASKAAVRQLTKSVAQYCAEQRLNVRCNSVHPGNVRTPLWNKHAAEMAEMRGVSVGVIVQEAQALVPLGDFTLAEDVAAAVAYFASDDARHVTGTQLIVDGGVTNCESYAVNVKSAGDVHASRGAASS